MVFKSFFRKQKMEPVPVSTKKPDAPHASAEDISHMFISTLLAKDDDNSIGTSNTVDHELTAKIMEELSNFDSSTIPKLANASLELMDTLMDENVSSAEVVRIIKEDPVLLGNLLKQANSAFYRTNKTEIATLEDAVVMLGNNGVRKLVIDALVTDELRISSIYFRFFGANIWQHSYEVANIAVKYAAMKNINEFRAYLNGLLHDVGKLVIFKLLIEVLEKAAPGSYPSKSFFMNIMDRYGHQFTLMALKEWELNPEWIRPILTYRSHVKLDSMDHYSQSLYIANHCSELSQLNKLKLISDEELSRQLFSLGIQLPLYKELMG